MESQVKVLGWLYIILGVIGALAAACLGSLIIGGGFFLQDDGATRIIPIVAIVLGSIVLILSLPGIAAGIGLLQYRPWARILAIVLGILNLPGFPVGTILGVYTLIVLLDERSSELFEHNSIMQSETTLAP